MSLNQNIFMNKNKHCYKQKLALQLLKKNFFQIKLRHRGKPLSMSKWIILFSLNLLTNFSKFVNSS